MHASDPGPGDKRILRIDSETDELNAICTGIPYCFAGRAVESESEIYWNEPVCPGQLRVAPLKEGAI